MPLEADEQPLSVQAVNGEVVMTGPRVAIALQPPAAEETARRLSAAAESAWLQQQGGVTDN
jgi:hypothetical protein